MTRPLSSQANPETVGKEARQLLHALRQHDATALRRYHAHECLNGTFAPSLAEAQYVIAREYGYSSWRRLQDRLDHHKQFANGQTGKHVH
jgi:hypothetical protein